MSENRVIVRLDELQNMTKRLQRGMPRAVARGVRQWLFRIVANVTKTKLLGQRLNRRTGTLIRSITASPVVEVSEQHVRGTFGSHLVYARVHELGFSGPVQVRAHVRRIVKLRMRAGKVTKSSARKVKRRLREGRALTTHVRAHTRRVDFWARYYMRDAMREEQERGVQSVRESLLALVRPHGGDRGGLVV